MDPRSSTYPLLQPSLDPSGATRWRIAPRFTVRMTGFPIEFLAAVRFEESRAAILDLRNAPTPEAHDRLEIRAQEVFEAELVRNTAALRGLGQTEAFREAVFLSNSASFPQIEKWIDGRVASPSKVRSGVLTSSLYLQRFCAKNDTASFFGPTFWGRIGEENGPCIRVESWSGPKFRRATFFAHWAVNALAQWATRFPEAERAIQPRRVPSVALVGNRIIGVRPAIDRWQVVDEPLAVPPEAPALYALVDGERTVDRLLIEAQIRLGLDAETARVALAALVNAGLVTAHIEIPPGLFEPMEYLVNLLEHCGKDVAVHVMREMLELKRRFEVAPLTKRRELLAAMEHLFVSTTGISPHRGAGQMYADRSIVYEEAERNFAAFEVGGQLLSDFNDLCTILDLLWTVTERDQELTQELITDWFSAQFPSEQRVPFLTYARAFVKDIEHIRQLMDHAAGELQRITKQVYESLVPADKADSQVVRLTMDEIREVLARLGVVAAQGAVVNPDLTIAATSLEGLNNGDYRLVVGELHAHHDLLTHSSWSFFLSQEDQRRLGRFVSERYAEAATPDEVVVNVVREHVHKTNAHILLDGPDVEVQGRSRKPREEVTSLAELEVRLVQGRLRLFAPKWNRFVRLTVSRVPSGSNERTSPLRPFSFPRRETVLPVPDQVKVIPRIEVGRTVLQRRAWRADYADWKPESDVEKPGWSLGLYSRALELQQTLGLPERVFAKVAGERKGTLLDFSNYFLVHAFFKLWREHGGAATFTELCPDFHENWLSDVDGHYSCELRTGFFRKSTRESRE